jgi:hypothetical protein
MNFSHNAREAFGLETTGCEASGLLLPLNFVWTFTYVSDVWELEISAIPPAFLRTKPLLSKVWIMYLDSKSLRLVVVPQ